MSQQYFKSKKRCPSVCYDHQFILTPKRDCWIKSPINIDYCPIFNEFTYLYEDVIPKPNFDNNPWLPAFVIDLDKIQYQFNMDRYQSEHQYKIDEANQRKVKLQMPKPGRKHRYCGVCKKNYEEYIDHIASQEHVVNFHQFRAVSLIKTLTLGYQIDDAEHPQSIIDSNTKLPLNKENFGLYFDKERIGLRFQKEMPKIEQYQIPQPRRGRPPKAAAAKKKVKQDPTDFYQMQQQYLQQQQYYPPPVITQEQQNQYLLDQQFRQRLQQQQSQMIQINEDKEREYQDRNHLWQRLIQLTHNQQPQNNGNDIVQLVQSIIESYENNPRYQEQP